MVLFVVVFLVLKNYCYYEKIDSKFLVFGHSYLVCVIDFKVIEKKKRVNTYMVQEEVYAMIRFVTLENLFKVISTEKFDFFDIVRT